MAWLDRIMNFVGSVLPALFLAIVLIVVTINVFARTVLGLPFYMAHDIAILAFAGVVWLGLVGIAVNGQLFGVEFFVSLLSKRWQKRVRFLAHIVVIIIALYVMHAAYNQITTARFSRFLALGWPKWIVSAGLFTGMGLMIIVQIQQLWQLFIGTPSREEQV